ncbi:MAG: aminotransferase class I/II-fold pyridoxal phosphate-dependent enzyme, partial [Pseudomonadota bacterium]|nr:aminotransferase class I/II-fold pyridoxal phosphate-dependent enzyme [Pseudomonadota bacterium]
VTVGSSGALLVLYAILLNAHEQLLLPDPGYPCYKNFAAILDIQPLLVPIDQHGHYQLTVDKIKQYQNIKAIQIASPANPIGNVYPPAALKAIVEYCDDHAIYFISDELYHGLAYETAAQTALAFSDNAIVVNGLSKYFSLPGLRLGWAIVPKNLVRKAEIVMQNVYISAPIISQQAALAAFDDAYLMSVTQMYRQRRDYLYAQLEQLFTIDAKPEGGFYIWANTTRYAEDSLKFSQLLLDEIGVATTAGIDFGKNNTQNYLRFAYTRDVPHLQEGVRRLKQFLKPELL